MNMQINEAPENKWWGNDSDILQSPSTCSAWLNQVTQMRYSHKPERSVHVGSDRVGYRMLTPVFSMTDDSCPHGSDSHLRLPDKRLIVYFGNATDATTVVRRSH